MNIVVYNEQKKNVQRYIDFDKDVSTSPDATIPEIVRNKIETD